MKKLLLYLMAVIAFGFSPVDSFADYLRVVTQNADGSWSGSTSTVTSADITLNNGRAGTKTDVPIGTGRFAIGIIDGNNRIKWLRPQGTTGVATIDPNNVYKYSEINSSASVLPGFTAANHAVMQIADGKASEGETFSVELTSRGELVVSTDYTTYKAYYKGDGAEKSTNLSFGGDATFDVKTDNAGKFTARVVSDKGVAMGMNIGSLENENWGTDPRCLTKMNVTFSQAGSQEISGLKPDTYYRVSIGYGDRRFYIEELPISVYVAGPAVNDPDWAVNNPDANLRDDRDSNRLIESGGIYSIIMTPSTAGVFDGKTYLAIRCGTKQYTVDTSNNTNYYWDGKTSEWLTLVPSVNKNYIEYTANAPADGQQLYIRVSLNQAGEPELLSLEFVDGDVNTDYQNYILTTHYRADNSGRTQSHSVRNAELVDGYWKSVDNGNIDLNDGDTAIYDGLGLGYDGFYLESYNPATATNAYWAVAGEISPDTPVQLNRYATSAEALAQGMHVANTGQNNVNSRYNIVWNWTTRELTVQLNDEWTSNPNQMYLYKLDDEEDPSTVTMDKVNYYLDFADTQNKVFILPLLGNADAVYQTRFDKNDKEDLPQNTKFCLVGRTGRVYNIATEDGSSFELGRDWKDPTEAYHLPMTRDIAQAPAIVTTSTLANTDFVVTVRANYTSSEEGIKNTYVISFMVEEETPVKFVITKKGDSVEHDLIPDENGNYSLTGLGLENGQTYIVTAVFEDGSKVQYGPIDGYNVYNEIDRQLAKYEGNGSFEPTDNFIYVKVDNEPMTNADKWNYSNKWDRGLWVYTYNSELFGAWPGKQIATTPQIINGETYFVISPEVINLDENGGIILNNGIANGGNGYKPDGFTGTAEEFNTYHNANKLQATITSEQMNPNGTVAYYINSAGKEGNVFVLQETNVPEVPVVSSEAAPGFKIGTNQFANNSRINIQWNNGRPMIQIRKFGEEKTVRIYFINRAKWAANDGQIWCYNYSDTGLESQNATNALHSAWKETTESNGGWPGVEMQRLTNAMGGLYTKLGLEGKGIDIFYMDLKVLENDGLYSYPKVIFNNGDKQAQTGNLYLVDGGIYTNSSPEENGIVEHPATVYMPRMQYTYMQGTDADLLIYPNEFYEAGYNYIYLEDKRLIEWYDANPNDHGIAVSVTYDKDGDGIKEFVATGKPGTHKMEKVTIGKKTYMRVALAEDVIPNNIQVDLSFWPLNVVYGNNPDDYDKWGAMHFVQEFPDYLKSGTEHYPYNAQVQPDNNYDAWYNNNRSNHKAGDHSLTEKCSYTYPNGGPTYNYTGAHFTCANSLCSLNFTNVEYKDGNIYRRYIASDGSTTQDPVVHIVDEVKPYAFYIVPQQPSAFDGAVKENCLDPNPVSLKLSDSQSVNGYKMTYTDTGDTNKLTYILPNVSPAANFYLVADLGTEGNPDYVVYSGVGDAEGLTWMRTGQWYKYFNLPQTNHFVIDRSVSAFAKSYEIRVSWDDSQVTAIANKADAEFEFVAYNDGEYRSLFGGGYLLPAHTDDCMKAAESEPHLTPLYFTYAYGYDMSAEVDGNTSFNDSRLRNLEVKIVREREFDRYFPDNTVNKVARIVKHKEVFEPQSEKNEGYMRIGDPFGDVDEGCITIIKPSYKDPKTGIEYKGLARVYMIGYTAVLTNVSVSQIASSNNFEPSTKTVPIRIYPTFESVGMTINNYEINKECEYKDENDNVTKLTPFAQNEEGIYSVSLANEAHTSYDKPNKPVEFGDRLQFQTALADNGKAAWDWVQITWCENPDVISTDNQTPRQFRAATTEINTSTNAPAYAQSILLSNVKNEPFSGEHTSEQGNTLDLGEYSIYNAPRVEIDKDGNATAPKSFYVKLTQNGISSPAYRLDVNRESVNNIPTQVEEILGADNDAEAVYYNLNGVKVDGERLEPGIYVKVQGSKSEKIYIR